MTLFGLVSGCALWRCGLRRPPAAVQDFAVSCSMMNDPPRLVWCLREKGSGAVIAMSMVWPCPLTVECTRGRAGRCRSLVLSARVRGPVVFWSGYRRMSVGRAVPEDLRAAGRCGRCGVTHACPAFALAWRLDAADAAGAVIGQVAGGGRGPPGGGRGGVPHTTARGWVRGFAARAGELAVSFSALAVELGGRGPAAPDPPGGSPWRRSRRRSLRRPGARMGGAGTVAVRQRGDRREPARRQRRLALADHRQEAFHASQEPVTAGSRHKGRGAPDG